MYTVLILEIPVCLRQPPLNPPAVRGLFINRGGCVG